MPRRLNAALELMMKLTEICGLLSLLLGSAASAVCVDVPFDEQVRTADAVFVATLVAAEVVEPDKLVERSRLITEFGFVVRQVLKGDPHRTRRIYTVALYDDPGDGRIFYHAEGTRLSLGQSVLVLANGSEDVEINLCSGSRLATTENLKQAKAVVEF